MAFTAAEQSYIRRYLGYSELFKDLDTRLESQMAMIGSRSPTAEAQVRILIGQVQGIDAKINFAALNNLDVESVDGGDVKMLGPDQIEALRAYGRQLIQQISITFETPPKRDYYATGDTGGMFSVG